MKERKNIYGRAALTRFRSGNHCLAVNTGRWTTPKTNRAERYCDWCMAENILAVEDERHVVLDCGAYATDRQKMWDARELVNGGTDLTARKTRFREVLGDYTLRQVRGPGGEGSAD